MSMRPRGKVDWWGGTICEQHRGVSFLCILFSGFPPSQPRNGAMRESSSFCTLRFFLLFLFV